MHGRKPGRHRIMRWRPVCIAGDLKWGAARTAPNRKDPTIRKLIEQLVKFGLVGVVAFVIDYGVLMLLSQVLGIDPVFSAAVSFCVSVAFNYLASMRYVFQRREDMSRHREFAIFVGLSVVGLVINELIMLAGTLVLGTGALAVSVTKVAATAIVMVWNFLSRKKWLEAK